jgi:hypothetical protein
MAGNTLGDKKNFNYYSDQDKLVQDIMRARKSYNNDQLDTKKPKYSQQPISNVKIMKTDIEAVKKAEAERLAVEEAEKKQHKNSAIQIVSYWASSTKNMVGAMAAGGVALTGTLVGIGGWAPLLAAGAYAVSTLFVPDDDNSKKAAALTHEASEDKKEKKKAKPDKVIPEQQQIMDTIKGIKDNVSENGKKLSEDSKNTLNNIYAIIDDITDNYGMVEQNVDSRILLHNIIHQYLPDTINEFVVLPTSYTVMQKMSGKKSPRQVFDDNLKLIEKAAHELRDTVYSNNLKNLEVQSKFLEQKLVKRVSELAIEAKDED